MKWSDPMRLADEARAGELGESIRAARGAHGSAREVEQLAARMAGVAGAASRTAAKASGASPLVKALLGGAFVAAVGLGFWLAPGESGEAPPSARPVAPAKVGAPPPSASAAAPAATPQAAASSVEPAAPGPTRRRSLPRVASVPAAPSPEQELALLERSRAALDRDPALALGAAQAHARAYPNGILAQEREVLAIEALLKLRRRAAAIARAEQFVRHYPESSHMRRVRALLEREGLTVPATIEARPGDSSGDAERERGEHEIER